MIDSITGIIQRKEPTNLFIDMNGMVSVEDPCVTARRGPNFRSILGINRSITP